MYIYIYAHKNHCYFRTKFSNILLDNAVISAFISIEINISSHLVILYMFEQYTFRNQNFFSNIQVFMHYNTYRSRWMFSCLWGGNRMWMIHTSTYWEKIIFLSIISEDGWKIKFLLLNVSEVNYSNCNIVNGKWEWGRISWSYKVLENASQVCLF